MAEEDLKPEQIRREIHFEHTQISQRMGWYASAQAFMFTAYVLSANNDFAAIPKFYLPTLGMLFSTFAWIAIVMAVIRLKGWWKQQPQWAEFRAIWQWSALAYPLVTPIFIFIFWLKLL